MARILLPACLFVASVVTLVTQNSLLSSRLSAPNLPKFLSKEVRVGEISVTSVTDVTCG